MNRFINLKISKLYNYLITSNKRKISNESKNDISKIDIESKLPYSIILNNLILFLSKKLTPFLFQEVKNFLNIQFIKYGNKPPNNINNDKNRSYSKLSFNSDNINNKKNNSNINNKKENIKNKFKLIEKKTQTNLLIGKKSYIPKSEKKINYSGNKCQKFEENKNKKDINSLLFNKSKEAKKRSRKCLFSEDFTSNKNINEIISLKTLINRQVQRHKTNPKIKNNYNSKNKQDHSFNSSNNNSISDSRDIFSTNNNRKISTNSYYNKNNNSKNKKIISNIFYTTRKYNVNKNYLLNNENQVYSSSKKKNYLTKNHPLLNEKLLYQLSFNNYNDNNNTNHKNSGLNYSLKKNKNDKNNIHVYQGINYLSKNKKNNINTTKQNRLINSIKSKKYSNKLNNYSTMNNNKNIKSQRNTNYSQLNYINLVNGTEKKNITTKNIFYNLDMETNSFNDNLNENKNLVNKKYKLLNEEMMKKIKNSLDDNLKIMFNFSYENFLSKESEQESKEYSLEKGKYIEQRNYSGEKF